MAPSSSGPRPSSCSPGAVAAAVVNMPPTHRRHVRTSSGTPAPRFLPSPRPVSPRPHRPRGSRADDRQRVGLDVAPPTPASRRISHGSGVRPCSSSVPTTTNVRNDIRPAGSSAGQRRQQHAEGGGQRHHARMPARHHECLCGGRPSGRAAVGRASAGAADANSQTIRTASTVANLPRPTTAPPPGRHPPTRAAVLRQLQADEQNITIPAVTERCAHRMVLQAGRVTSLGGRRPEDQRRHHDGQRTRNRCTLGEQIDDERCDQPDGAFPDGVVVEPVPGPRRSPTRSRCRPRRRRRPPGEHPAMMSPTLYSADRAASYSARRSSAVASETGSRRRAGSSCVAAARPPADRRGETAIPAARPVAPSTTAAGGVGSHHVYATKPTAPGRRQQQAHGGTAMEAMFLPPVRF